MSDYDSKGFNTGLKVKGLIQDLELQFITNKKAVFERSIKAPNFRNSVFSLFERYNNSNAAAGRDLMVDVVGILSSDIDKSFQYGKSEVDRQIDGYKKQGFKPVREPSDDRVQYLAKTTVISSAITAISGIINYSIENARRQLTAVTMQVNPNSDNLAFEIDRVQGLMFNNGIQGGINKGGEMAMGSLAELTTRNETFEATLQAQAIRREEYALNLIQVSAHPSSCPLCVPWQTRVLIDDIRQSGKADGKYELYSVAIAAGLHHHNCRHTTIPFIPGYSNPNIFDYDKANNKETAKRYAVEQLQRNNERNIRQYKIREAEALSPENRDKASQKVREWQARQRELQKIAESEGLPFYRQYTREQIGGETKPTLMAGTEYIERNYKPLQNSAKKIN